MSGNVFHLGFIGPGGGEMVVVMLVLLLLFGSKDAPRMLRKLADILNKIRSTAEKFKHEVMYGDLGQEPDEGLDLDGLLEQDEPGEAAPKAEEDGDGDVRKV